MAALPLFKVFAILFKEASKPMAAEIKRQAQAHPVTRRWTMAVGRNYESFTHRIDVTFRGHKMKATSPDGSIAAPRITDASALTIGADIISQTFLISVALGLATFEYSRGAASKAAESAARKELEAQRDEAIINMQQRIMALEEVVISMQAAAAEKETSRAGGWLPAWVTGHNPQTAAGASSPTAGLPPAAPGPTPTPATLPAAARIMTVAAGADSVAAAAGSAAPTAAAAGAPASVGAASRTARPSSAAGSATTGSSESSVRGVRSGEYPAGSVHFTVPSAAVPQPPLYMGSIHLSPHVQELRAAVRSHAAEAAHARGAAQGGSAHTDAVAAAPTPAGATTRAAVHHPVTSGKLQARSGASDPAPPAGSLPA